jgi:uncharacterized protein (TIGR03089 family)
VPAPADLLEVALRRDPAGPLLTFYDDSTGERTELSATTLANWVAKTANLLRDDVGAVPGDRVAVLLPAHWQTAAVLFGAWSVGAVVSTEPEGALAAFAARARSAEARSAEGAGEVFALALAPLGRGFAGGPPAGARDYTAEVRAMGDAFTGPRVADAAPALDTQDGTVAAGDLVEIAVRRAAELGLTASDRLLSTAPWDGPTDWVDGLLVPFAAGASLVLCVEPDQGLMEMRVEAERVTATLGVTVPGIRPL